MAETTSKSARLKLSKTEGAVIGRSVRRRSCSGVVACSVCIRRAAFLSVTRGIISTTAAMDSNEIPVDATTVTQMPPVTMALTLGIVAGYLITTYGNTLIAKRFCDLTSSHSA